MTAGASTAYYAALIAENKKRDRAAENDIPEDEKVLMGDLSPDYRYML